MKKAKIFVTTYWSYILLVIIGTVVLFVEAGGSGDFEIFLSASNDLMAGKNIYQIKYHEWYHYYYDVLFAIVISPLRHIPIYWASFIWLICNLFFTFRIWKITNYYLPFEHFKKDTKRTLSILIIAFIFTLWHKNIHLTQMTIFILYLSMEGLYKIQNNKNIFGGLLLGIGISIKILPIILIPYLVYRGYFKGAILSIVSTIMVLFIPMLFIGFDYHLFLLQERWTLINPSNKEHILDVSERSFHSLTTLLATLFVENASDQHAMNLKRNIANVDLKTLSTIITIARLALIAGTLYIIRSMPFKKTSQKLQLFHEMSYIFLITPLLFPHQQHYAFFYAFPAIAYLIYFYYTLHFNERKDEYKKKRIVLLSFGVLIFLLLNSHFLFGSFRNVFDHFKTLTYGILCLVFLLLFANNKRIEAIDPEITPR